MKKSLITVLLLTLYGCGGGGSDKTDTSPVTPSPKSYSLTGNFEKGPFIIGSEITIQEFDDNLVSTGKTFHTETSNNVGSYNMDISLTEELVEVSADGYYFNEISGELSNSKLRLSVLASVADNENININILTHLSKKRIITLVNDGKVFSVAKKQAEEEVQKLFDFITVDWEINDFDRMNISEYGDNNSYLLLVSAIIQNINMSTPQLSEYIERLAQDLSDNGIVNDDTLLESINLSSQDVDLSIVRVNLITRYDGLGETLNLPDFEQLINRAPVADAGTDISSYSNTEIILDGSKSDDIDNDSLSYSWSLITSPEGSVVEIANADSLSASLTFNLQGSYQVSLIVSDGELSSDVDVVNVSTTNRAPIAEAGLNFSIMIGESITLDGSNSYDPDGDNLIYQWISVNRGDLSVSGMVVDAGVIPPIEPAWSESHPTSMFKLKVTDSHDFYSEDFVTVTYLPNLVDNNDGTISDGFGTMWQKDESEELINVYYANAYCSNLVIGQYEDWRIPSVNELYRLIDKSVGSPTINTNLFPSTFSTLYVTSYFEQGAKVFDFSDGSLIWSTVDPVHARCIR